VTSLRPDDEPVLQTAAPTTRLEGGYLAVLTDTPRHAGRPLPKKPVIPLLVVGYSAYRTGGVGRGGMINVLVMVSGMPRPGDMPG
jgi:hypothetical protein